MLLLLSACTSTAPDTDTDPPTDTGSPTDTAPADCAFAAPSDRLSLADGCVDGLCGGTVYTGAVAALGEPDACSAAGSVATCTWGDLSVTFPDCDHDSAPDDTYVCDMFDQAVVVSGGWDGADEHGLGLGVDAACWVEALGEPSSFGWTYGDDPWVTVTIDPVEGPVTTITLDWSWDE